MTFLLSILTGINWKEIFSFLTKYWKEVLIAVLAACLMLKIKENNVLQDNLDKAGDNLKLNAGEIAKVVIQNGQLRSAGTGKGSSKPGYVPPEATVTATLERNRKLQEQLDSLNQQIATLQTKPSASSTELEALKKERDELAGRVYTLNVTYNKWGFAFHPGLGFVWSNKLLPLVDAKIIYWDRYSGEFGVTPEYFGLGFSRHIDDLTPSVLKISNTEAGILVGKEYDLKSWRLGGGLRINW